MEKGFQVDVLDHGYLRLLDWLGNDQYLADIARTSTGSTGKSTGLVTRLVRDRHSSPIEFGIIQFEIKAPLFVFREWHRHRTQSYSELSARFGELPNDYYLPTLERFNPQSTTNKQMSDESQVIETAEVARSAWKVKSDSFFSSARNFAEAFPLARELSARLFPQHRYTVCCASGNLWNWFAFLSLRCKLDAQFEIRQYALQILVILKELFPIATMAFEEHMLYAISFSKIEIELLRVPIEEYKGGLEWQTIQNKLDQQQKFVESVA